MQFSERSHFGLVDEAALALSAQLEARGVDFDLTPSNPTLVGLSGLPEGLHLPPELPYAPDPRGSWAARERIAKSYQARQSVTPEEVFVTASTSEAYSFLFLALCDPGDALLAPRPSYPLFDDLARLCSVRLIDYRLAYDGKWHLDRASLPSAETVRRERIRGVLAVSPNNPTGNCLRSEDLRVLSALGLPLLVDEVFRPYQKPACGAVDPLERDWEVPLVLLDGLSKRACAPGLKLGWILARGPGAAALLERLEWLGDTYLSVNSLSQVLLPAVFRDEQGVQRRVNERLDENERALSEIAEQSPLTVLDREGGWCSIVRLPALLSEEQWLRRLAQVGVRVQAGRLYGLPQDPACVISLLTRPEIFRQGVVRMVRVAREL